MNDNAFEHDLRAALASRTYHEVPASLYTAIRVLATMPGPGRRLRLPGLNFGRFTSAVATLVGATLVVALGGVLVMGYAGLSSQGVGSGGEHNFNWHTQFASLETDSLSIEAAGRIFRPPADASLQSDPGDSSYRTLEMEWSEQGLEQRLYIYFAADDTEWWVTGIRTRDGLSPAEWVYYQAPQVRVARGGSYVGDLDLSGSGQNGDARLRISNMRLTAFAPGTGVTYANGCHPVGPISHPGDQPVPVPGNPDVQGVVLRIGMPASEADVQLTKAGICREFRYDYPASNQGQTWCAAPPGDVTEWAFGSDGQLILFVEAGPAETLPPDAPRVVGCS